MFPSSPLWLELSGAGGSQDLPLVFLFPFHSPASFLTSPEFPVFTAIWAAGSCLQAIWLNALEKKKKHGRQELLQITLQLLFITPALASISPTAPLKG